MATRSLSAFDLRQLWPAKWGAAGKLVITLTRSVVSEDGVEYPATSNEGGPLSSLGYHWESTITVASSLASTGVVSGLINTDSAEPAHVATYNVYVYDARGKMREQLNSKPFHLHESLNGGVVGFTWRQWVNANEFTQHRGDLVFIGDRVTVQSMIDSSLSGKANVSPQYGITALSVAPVSANNPIAVGDNDPRLAVTADASTTVKGVTKLSVAPAVANNPIAAGTNDPRLEAYNSQLVAQFNGQSSITHGPFWTPDTDLTNRCFYELLVCPHETLSENARYFFSDGSGGAHAILMGLTSSGLSDGRYGVSGNMLTRNGGVETVISFGGDTGPAPGEWGFCAVGWDETINKIVTYFNGIPVGSQDMIGPRGSPAGFDGVLYVGGSNHQNMFGRVAWLRVFEGANPRIDGSSILKQYWAYDPESVPGPFSPGPSYPGAVPNSYLSASLVADYTRASRLIADLSPAGYGGRFHHGKMKAMNTPFSPYSGGTNYPLPQFVIDPTFPFLTSTAAPVQPTGLIDTPPATPANALIYDSFSRKSSIYAFDKIGGMGSTEAGSFGALPWNVSQLATAGYYDYGLLNGSVVPLAPAGAYAYVDPPSANLDITTERRRGIWNSGTNTGILFRYVDVNNFWYAVTSDSSFDSFTGSATPVLTVRKVVAGVPTTIRNHISMAAAGVWTSLRVVTKSDGTVTVYADATQLSTDTDASLASATKCGITNYPAYGVALACRWNSFLVKAAV